MMHTFSSNEIVSFRLLVIIVEIGRSKLAFDCVSDDVWFIVGGYKWFSSKSRRILPLVCSGYSNDVWVTGWAWVIGILTFAFLHQKTYS
jgi:hypothetical protein